MRQLLVKHQLTRGGVGRRIPMWVESSKKKGVGINAPAFSHSHVRVSTTLFETGRPSVAIERSRGKAQLKFNREVYDVAWVGNSAGGDCDQILGTMSDSNPAKADLKRQIERIRESHDRRLRKISDDDPDKPAKEQAMANQLEKSYVQWADTHLAFVSVQASVGGHCVLNNGLRFLNPMAQKREYKPCVLRSSYIQGGTDAVDLDFFPDIHHGLKGPLVEFHDAVARDIEKNLTLTLPVTLKGSALHAHVHHELDRQIRSPEADFISYMDFMSRHMREEVQHLAQFAATWDPSGTKRNNM